MGTLTWLHPWLLAGLAGAALPVLIHLIGRKRAPTVYFAAFDFLMAVNQRLARRERLRQLLLLVLRTAAVASLALAAARPMPVTHRAAAANVSRRVAMVIDTSASMNYQHGGKSLLAHAQAQGRDILSHLQPGDAATLVVAGPQVRAFFAGPTLRHADVRDALDTLKTADGVADLGGAIDKALAQLGADGANATLVVISDLAQNSFDHLRPTAMDPPPDIRLVDAAERPQPLALGNALLEDVRVERSVESAAERQFKVVVRNHGSAPVTGRPIELWVGNTVTQRSFVDVPARGTAERILTHAFDTPGVYNTTVRLAAAADDGYPRDDAMQLVVDVARGVRVLAVNGEPRTTPHEDELFFLERALAAVPRGDPPISLNIIEVNQLGADGLDLANFDAVVVANVGTLSPAQVQTLRVFVDNGGGLLFTLGSQVHFEAANASLGDLLPHPLRDLHLAADQAAGTPALGMGGFDWDHPIMQGLGSAAEESLRASRTARYFNLDVGAGLKARPILRFENGAPALIEARRSGKGRVLLLTTTVDLDYTDLPIRTAFVAVLQRTVRYLARAVEGNGGASVRQGGAAEVPVPTGAVSFALTSPAGVRIAQALAPNQGGRVRFVNLQETGLYRADVQRKEWAPEPRLDVAVNPLLDESDFLPVRPDRIAEALGGNQPGHTVNVTLGRGDQGDPFAIRGFASYVLLALCLLFVSESLLAARG